MHKYLSLIFLVLALSCLSCGQQVVVTCPSIGVVSCPVAGSIVVTAVPSVILANGVSILTARAVDSTGFPNIDLTGTCSFASSNSLVASITTGSLPTVLGISSGTVQVSCSQGGITSNSVAVTVDTNPSITGPTCAIQPCALSATNGRPYSSQFTASGGVGALTWTITVGSVPTGLTFPTTGLLSGTPTVNATTNFTARVCDTLPLCKSVQIAFTVVGATCGPPTYTCSTTSTANPVPIAPIFIATSPTVSTCSGDCQNSVHYDTTLNPSLTNPISRLTDGATFPSGPSVGNVTCSGGSNDVMGSSNETYIGLAEGGSAWIQHMSVGGDGSYQVVNTGRPGMFIACPFGFSRAVDTRFYHITGITKLYQGDITSDSTYTNTELFDLTGATGPGASQCPGVNWSTFGTPNVASILSIATDDHRFAWMVGTNNQGSPDWVFSWDRTLGCSSANFHTGQWWTWCLTSCSSSTPPSGTFPSTGCYGSQGATGHGMHDTQMTADGNYLWISFTGGGWTGGACNGVTITTQATIWQIGTGGDQWGYAANSQGSGGAQLGGHWSAGVTHTLTPYFAGPNTRLTSNVASFTTFAPTVITNDQHCSWPHPTGDDSYPWVCASDLALDINNSGCAVHALCPTYLQDVIYAWYPNATNQAPAIFTHTFSCNYVGGIVAHCATGTGDAYFGAQNAIGFATAKGNYFVWASTHLNSLGNDNQGKPRQDAFAVRLQ